MSISPNIQNEFHAKLQTEAQDHGQDIEVVPLIIFAK